MPEQSKIEDTESEVAEVDEKDEAGGSEPERDDERMGDIYSPASPESPRRAGIDATRTPGVEEEDSVARRHGEVIDARPGDEKISRNRKSRRRHPRRRRTRFEL